MFVHDLLVSPVYRLGTTDSHTRPRTTLYTVHGPLPPEARPHSSLTTLPPHPLLQGPSSSSSVFPFPPPFLGTQTVEVPLPRLRQPSSVQLSTSSETLGTRFDLEEDSYFPIEIFQILSMIVLLH